MTGHFAKRQKGMVHTFNPNTQRQKQMDICGLEAILVYTVSSWTTRENPVSKYKEGGGEKKRRRVGKDKHVLH